MGFVETISVEGLESDPYPIYAQLRREAPVTHVPAVNTWFVTRWADVERVGKDTESFSAEVPTSPVEKSFGSPTILTSDGAVHRELRGGIEPHYRPRKVADYIDGLVRPIAEDCADQIEGLETADLMSAYFEPISALSLARSLGLSSVDAATLRRWFHGLSQGAINFEMDPKRQEISDRVCAEIDDALTPHLARLEAEPDGSPLSHMLHHGMTAGATRPRGRVLPTIKITLLGGMQEPGHGAGSILAGLFANPAQFEALRADVDGLLPKAIEEGLRWVAPIGTIMRTARQDVALSGVTIPKGTPVSGVLSSASRDEARFSNPDAFDLHRRDGSHGAFGFGPHFCAGRWFSTGQIDIALRVLLARFPRLAQDESRMPVFRGWEFRAPTSLFVRLHG